MLNTVRSPTNDATANVAFRSAGLRQLEDSIVSAQRHNTPEDRGSRSMNSRIFFSVTIRTNPASHNGNQESTGEVHLTSSLPVRRSTPANPASRHPGWCTGGRQVVIAVISSIYGEHHDTTP